MLGGPRLERLGQLGVGVEAFELDAHERKTLVDYARSMRELLDYRSEFPILEHTTYLASHTLGPMPRRAPELLAQFADMWAERGIRSWAEGWWETSCEVGDQIGRIIGAPPDRP